MDAPFPCWDSTVGAIVNWAASDGQVRIGHIQGPHATGKSLYLPRAIWYVLTMRQHNTTVFHAVADSEFYRLSTIHEMGGPAGDWHRSVIDKASQRDQEPLGCMQVVSCLDLRMNLASQGVGEHAVEASLTRPVVFIVDLQLHCPANLALLLITLMTWAFPPMVPSASESVTILTMSANEPPRYLIDLLSVYNQTLRRFVLPLPPSPCRAGLDTVISVFADAESLADAVKQNVLSKRTPRAVVVLNPSDCLEEVCSRFHTVIHHAVQPVSRSNSGLVEYGERLARIFHMGPLDTWIRTVYIPRGDRWHVRCFPSGIAELHLVLSQETSSIILDRETGQLVDTTVPLSREERQEILSWVRRSGASRCYVYILGQDPEGSEYFSRGEDHRHWEVSNHQVLGFVVSLVRVQPWIMDSIPVFRCFMPENLVSEAIRRCCVMGILKHEQYDDGRTVLINCLPDASFLIFESILPVCDFDARLALLLALPSPTPSVSILKVDLAAIVAVGIGQVFLPWRCPNDDCMREQGEAIPVDWNDVFRQSCRNSASHIMGWGSVGALVGLWREIMSRMEIAGHGESSLDEPSSFLRYSNMHRLVNGYHWDVSARYSPLFLPHLNFGLDIAGACRVWCLREEILRTLDSFEMPLDMRAAPEAILPDKDQEIFRKDLVSTFMHGLGQVKMTDGLFEVEDYVSGHMVQPHDEVSKTVNWPMNWALKKRGRLDMVLGFRIGPLRRETSGKLTFNDWTWVPTGAVAEWRSRIEIPEAYSLTAALRSLSLSQDDVVEEPEHP